MYMFVCEQARWACSEGNSALEKKCIIIYLLLFLFQLFVTNLLLFEHQQKTAH